MLRYNANGGNDMYNILVCDDEKDIRRALNIYLTGEGYSVCETASGEEALAELRRSVYHLVLMDVMMPGLDGIERRSASGNSAISPSSS